MTITWTTTDSALVFPHAAPKMDLSLSYADALFSRLMGHNWLPRYAGSSGTGQVQEKQLHAPGYGPRFFQN